jgi:hypothetical protein
MKFDWSGAGIVNGVAESYTVSDDGLTWTSRSATTRNGPMRGPERG